MRVSRTMSTRIRIGISACLLGAKVRWNGADKSDELLVSLSRWVEWVPVCPEVEAGMGVPREPVQLRAHGRRFGMVGVESRTDWTARLERQAGVRLEELRGLRGFVFKSRSPSCGLTRVPVVSGARVSRTGTGLFAAAFRARYPELPCEEEGGFRRGQGAFAFFERAFAMARLGALPERVGARELARFHGVHALQLWSRSARAEAELARLAAEGDPQEYATLFAATIARRLPRAREERLLEEIAAGLGGLPARATVGRESLWELRRQVRELARTRGAAELRRQTFLSPVPAAIGARLSGAPGRR